MRSLIRYDKEACPDEYRMMCSNYLLIVILSALPCIGFSVYAWGGGILLLYMTASISGLLIEFLFARIRNTRFRASSLVTAALLVLILPVSTPVWLIVLATAFSVFFGQEVFGGAGYHIVNPVLLAKLFLMTGFLQEIYGPHFASAFDPERTGLWIIAGLLMLLPLLLQIAIQPRNLAILAGIALGTAAAIIWMHAMDVLPYDSVFQVLVLDSFAFVVCFIVFDPAIAPYGTWARILYGLIIALLAFLIGTFSDKYPEGIIVALLFGNLLAPLLDRLFTLKVEADENGG